MSDQLTDILGQYRDEMERIFGSSLEKVILFGSYARGDYHEGSDLDIMILADIKSEEVSRFSDKVYDVTYDFELYHGIEINPCVQDLQAFNRWKKAYPFFMNIEKEGVPV